MRIKIIGENNCARATRHLLRLAGFAVTEFLPVDAVIHAPHSGYAITIELAPAQPLTSPVEIPGGAPSEELEQATHGQPAAVHGEASLLVNGASSCLFSRGASAEEGVALGELQNHRMKPVPLEALRWPVRTRILPRGAGGTFILILAMGSWRRRCCGMCRGWRRCR